MTKRSVILGLLGAAGICGFTYINDALMKQTHFVGNNMPFSVYGGLIVFVLAVNPALYYLGKRLAFGGRELAVVLALTLSACAVPGSGLLRTFTSSLMMPRHLERTRPGWKEQKVLAMLPGRMLAGVGPEVLREDVLDPRGLAARLVREGAGEGATAPGRLIWGLLPEDDRERLKECAGAALAPPDEAAREEALREAGRALSEAGEADVEAALAEIRAAVSAASPNAASDAAAARRVDEALAGLGFGSNDRERVLAAVRNALAARDGACRRAVARALNRAIGNEALREGAAIPGLDLSPEGRGLLERDAASRDDAAPPAEGNRPAPLDPDETRLVNRHIVDAVCSGGLRSIGASDDHARNGFVQGLAVGTERIPFSRVPWYAWRRTLLFWVPLILVLWTGLIALSVVVHRQWATHEQLPYPIAKFANALLPEEGRLLGGIFRDRLFWVGGGVVFLLHTNNYAYAWFPGLVRIPTNVDFGSLRPLFPVLDRGAWSWAVFDPRIYFSVVAFAFFLPADVSLSLGIAPLCYCFLTGLLAGYGIAAGGGGYLAVNIERFLMFGAYFGIFLAIVYAGRHYYKSVFRRALALRSTDEVEAQAVWAARVFMLAFIVFVADLVFLGLDWPLALLYSGGTVMLFLVMSRISAETGLFFIQPYWMPGVILAGLLGASALGPRTMLMMFFLTTILMVDPREALMPFIANACKVIDDRKVSVGRTALWCAAAVVLGLAVALPVTLYLQYDRGANMADGWATSGVPCFALEAAIGAKERLAAQGKLAAAETTSGFARLAHASTSWSVVVSFVVAAGLVTLFTALRWRFPRWPLHPVIFLVWATYAAAVFAGSFLLGWLVKAMVTKYGGESAFRRLKPLMFGLVAGDMLGGLVPSMIGAIYYAVTRQPPRSFSVMPG